MLAKFDSVIEAEALLNWIVVMSMRNGMDIWYLQIGGL